MLVSAITEIANRFFGTTVGMYISSNGIITDNTAEFEYLELISK